MTDYISLYMDLSYLGLALCVAIVMRWLNTFVDDLLINKYKNYKKNNWDAQVFLLVLIVEVFIISYSIQYIPQYMLVATLVAYMLPLFLTMVSDCFGDESLKSGGSIEHYKYAQKHTLYRWLAKAQLVSGNRAWLKEIRDKKFKASGEEFSSDV